MIPVPQQQQQEDSEESDLDNEEEGGQWITPDNLHKHIGAAVTVPSHVLNRIEEIPDDGKPRFVQYITSDYAM